MQGRNTYALFMYVPISEGGILTLAVRSRWLRTARGGIPMFQVSDESKY